MLRLYPRRTLAVGLVIFPMLLLCLACPLVVVGAELLAMRLQHVTRTVTPVCFRLVGNSVRVWWNAFVPPARAADRAPGTGSLCVVVLWRAEWPDAGVDTLTLWP